MSAPKKKILIGGLVAIAVGVSVALWPPQSHDKSGTPMLSADVAAPTAGAMNATDGVASDLRDHPIVQAYQAFTEFQQHSRGFFDNADKLSDQEKQAQLRQLLDGTNQYEQQGKLVPMEALVLKLAMLRYSSSGDEDYKSKAKTLIDQYKVQSDLREQAWLANPDPKFVDYKRQENDIVKDVLAMTVIPDGLSRDEYLRQRLEQARIATMGAGGNGP